MTFSRSPILPSYNLPDLELTCQAFFGNGTMLSRAELVSYGYTFVWTKNGVYLNHTESSLSPVQLRELNVYTHTIESSQGAYRCGVKALPSGNIIWSQVVNVVLEGEHSAPKAYLDIFCFTNNMRVNK
ncbi:hypothetical protein HPB48_006173 [Haemaphysalis longicornis]|uniref:Uncharacterized protein n=1 Tax=Haemaphysalis longicornis TaxID=44386 RepID=A0A9J6GYX5_HAELO|nr:hypothetical protein HPB48_006173 [Haemaphysalis longicornis]